MRLTFDTLNRRKLTLNLDIEQFLQGPVMSHLAQRQNDCDPADIIRDHLPPILDEADDDEVSQAVAEACLLAVGDEHLEGSASVSFSTITDIVVDKSDLPYIRRRLLADSPPVLMFNASYMQPYPAA